MMVVVKLLGVFLSHPIPSIPPPPNKPRSEGDSGSSRRRSNEGVYNYSILSIVIHPFIGGGGD